MMQTIIYWNIVLMQKVEILKMASKVAVMYFPNTYLTNKVDVKYSNFEFFVDVKRPNTTND